MKIEFEIPEFEKELSINITIKKDGEVEYSTSASPSLIAPSQKPVKEEKKVENKSPKESTSEKPAGKPVGGNLMDMDF